jgi:hypothetical protein
MFLLRVRNILVSSCSWERKRSRCRYEGEMLQDSQQDSQLDSPGGYLLETADCHAIPSIAQPRPLRFVQVDPTKPTACRWAECAWLPNLEVKHRFVKPIHSRGKIHRASWSTSLEFQSVQNGERLILRASHLFIPVILESELLQGIIR